MMEYAVEQWPNVLVDLRATVGSDEFDNWFDSVRLESYHAGDLVLSVEGTGRKEWLEEHYLHLIEQTCAKRLGGEVRVQMTVQQPDRHVSRRMNMAPAPGHEALLEATLAAQPSVPSAPAGQPIHTFELNRRYTFEQFVRGPSNELAFSVSYAIADRPARAYNPLFVYGGSGLGKTHLMQAIGHRVREIYPSKVVAYVPAEEFVNEFVDATRKHAWAQFHARFRNVDVLLIDDIHFLAGKEGSQEQFFHTFNALYNAQKQIVISCDRPPRDIPTLEDRLKSRFEGGMITDIGPPDLETRVAILREKCRQERITLNDEVALYVANKIKHNIRQLEGALIRLAAHMSTYNLEHISVNTAAEVLSDLIAREERQVSVDTILDQVCKHYRIKVSEVLGTKRTRMISVPRRVAMYIARQLTHHSYPEIGALFGNKDHSTVMHACRRLEEDMAANEEMARKVEMLIQQIRST